MYDFSPACSGRTPNALDYKPNEFHDILKSFVKHFSVVYAFFVGFTPIIFPVSRRTSTAKIISAESVFATLALPTDGFNTASIFIGPRGWPRHYFCADSTYTCNFNILLILYYRHTLSSSSTTSPRPSSTRRALIIPVDRLKLTL